MRKCHASVVSQDPYNPTVTIRRWTRCNNDAELRELDNDPTGREGGRGLFAISLVGRILLDISRIAIAGRKAHGNEWYAQTCTNSGRPIKHQPPAWPFSALPYTTPGSVPRKKSFREEWGKIPLAHRTRSFLGYGPNRVLRRPTLRSLLDEARWPPGDAKPSQRRNRNRKQSHRFPTPLWMTPGFASASRNRSSFTMQSATQFGPPTQLVAFTLVASRPSVHGADLLEYLSHTVLACVAPRPYSAPIAALPSLLTGPFECPPLSPCVPPPCWHFQLPRPCSDLGFGSTAT